MIVYFLILVCVRILLAIGRSIVCAIEETVFIPRRNRGFHPFDMVGQVLTRSKVTHEDLLPVRAVARDGIKHIFPIFRKLDAKQRHRALRRKRVGVEQHPSALTRLVSHIEHRLILQSTVVEIIILAFFLCRSANLLHIKQIAQLAGNLFAIRQRLEILVGQFALGSHPGSRLRRCVVFKPPVWIGHLRAEIIIDHILTLSHRISQLRKFGSSIHSHSHASQYKSYFIHIHYVNKSH